jgi:ankyrin repeat protein
VNGIGNPLATAAQEGLTEAIKCLLEAGANPNTTDWVSLLSCSHYHCELLNF